MKQAKKTERRVQLDRRNAALIKERAELLSVEGAMPTAVDAYLGEKYRVGRSTIWKIVNNR